MSINGTEILNEKNGTNDGGVAPERDTADGDDDHKLSYKNYT